MNIRALITISILSFMSITVEAQDYSIASPDGNLVMTVHNGKKLTFDLSMGGRTLIAESPMGFSFKGEDDMDGNFCVTSIPAVTSGVEDWIPVVKNRHSRCSVPYRSITLRLREKSGAFRHMGLEIRMMNNAAAFRYTLYGNMNVGMRYITKELTGFSVPAEAALYKSDFAYTDEEHPFKSSQESEFTRTVVNELETGVPAGLPCLIQADNRTWMAITESYLDNFPAFHIIAGGTAGDRRMLHPRLTPLFTEPETELCARFDEEITSSWRVIMAADSPGRFIESDVIQSLNPPCAIKDHSWIKAGMSAWDHWWSDDIKMEMPVIKQYIDLAAAENWPYMLVDWTWYGPHTQADAIITKPAANIDMPEIIRYAKSKGVKIWLWLRSEDTNNNDAWREAFPLFHQWGVAGIKIDFMDREDQDMVNWYRRIIKACAENQLMVDFHGAYKPDGIERTYPNMMTREGVMGNEYNKWSHRVTPEHNVTLAFTRMIAGPMDYTPGGFRNVTIDKHDTSAPASVINTRAAELSKFVIYESPFTVFCDHPDYVLGQSGSDFLNAMPTEWDDTRFLGGLPDEYIAMARRHGSKWYIGVMGNSQARELTLDLSFISEGSKTVVYWQDGKKAAKNPSDILHGTLNLKAGAPLKVKLAPSGGFVATVEGECSFNTPVQARYFGLHFDFHASPERCPAIGSTLSENDIKEICTLYKPDFIQVDSKGHPGWSSYPTEYGDETPGIVGNPMDTWRKITKENGVQLYAHHSGVYDAIYCQKRPEEAIKAADGTPSGAYVRTNGSYADDKLIPQILELAGRYGLDGVWVDGDCWGAQMDFDPRTIAGFEKETSIKLGSVLPVNADSPYYMEYADYCRKLYRNYLKHYTDAVHAQYPDFKVISNWAYTEHMAGPVTADNDCISGDLDWKNSIMWGRYSGRSAVMQGKPWDMMAWSFRNVPGAQVTKTPVQLMQEGASIISLGGGFQFYVCQDANGAPNMKVLRHLAPTAEFFHQRREWTFGGKPRKQVAILMETAQRLAEQGQWSREGNTGLYTRAGYQRLMGLISILCDAGHSVSLISERELEDGKASGYPLIIIPELYQELQESTWNGLMTYAEAGGSVVLTGPETCRMYGYETRSRPDTYDKGNGKLAFYPWERSSSYMGNRKCEDRKDFSDFLLTLYDPEFRLVSANGLLEVVDFEKDGQLMAQLVNCNGNHYDEKSLTEDFIPPVLDAVLKIRLDKCPKAIILQPEGKELEFRWNEGYAEVTIPRIDIHSTIVVSQ